MPLLGLIGLGLLVRRRPAFGLLCVAILLIGAYVWANYLRLEHYLLVPWMILALGARSPSRVWPTGAASRVAPTVPGGASAATCGGVVTAVGIVALGFALVRRRPELGPPIGAPTGPARTTWTRSSWRCRRTRRSCPNGMPRRRCGTASTSRAERQDVLIVDDTNIVYEGWGTREARIASVICDRPTFILRISEVDLMPTMAEYTLTPFLRVHVAAGGPSGSLEREIYRVEPFPGTCGG